MDYIKPSHEAAGSSDRGRDHRRRTTSASRSGQPITEEWPHAHIGQRNVQPQSSPYAPEQDQPEIRSRRKSEQPEASSRWSSEHLLTSRRLSQQSSQRPSSASQEHQPKRESSISSEDWDLLEREDDAPSSPSYDFPGTWPTALHDTTTVLTHVSSATISYASALTHSGIGKASWSFGTAALSSTNKSALNFVHWATDRTGMRVDQLPRPIKRWLKSGAEEIEEQRRAELRIREIRVRRTMTERGWPMNEPVAFGDERGVFVLETAEMDKTGEFVGELTPLGKEDGFAEVSTRGGESGKGKTKEEPAEDSGGEGAKKRMG